MRVIPSIIIKNDDCFNTINFRESKYLGDPLNVVKIFSDLKADEILLINKDGFLDKEFLSTIVKQTSMPVSYAGNINSYNLASDILRLGIERIVLNGLIFDNPNAVEKLALTYGKQSLIGSICYKRSFFRKKLNFYRNQGKKKIDGFNLVELSKRFYDLGIGEILLSHINGDGNLKGIDFSTYSLMKNEVSCPIMLSGGCKSFEELFIAAEMGVSSVSCTTIFVEQGDLDGVVIKYPEKDMLFKLRSGNEI